MTKPEEGNNLCPICNEKLPEDFKATMEHMKGHKGERTEQIDEPVYNKMGNTQLAKLIDNSPEAYITVKVVYLDKETHTSRNGDFRRSIIEPVKNCNFERTAYLFGDSVATGKRIETAIRDEPELLTNQFELQMVVATVNRSRPFVDINDIFLLMNKQLSFAEVGDLFPTLGGLKVRRQ